MEENKENIEQKHLAGDVAHNLSQSQTSKYSCGNNGSTGHGFAAEDANALKDLLQGKKVDKIGSNNKRDGADRITDGVQIQSKYCNSAKNTIEAAFNKETGLYRYKIKNGKPMKLEVPRDQYGKAIEFMQQKILEGKVEGVKNPQHAFKMIKKGLLTYEQSLRVAKAGTVESIIYDAATGTVSCTAACGISAVITFIREKQKGSSTKVALKEAGKEGGKAAALTLATQVVVGQVEKAIVNTAAKKATQTAIQQATKTVAEQGTTSFAKSALSSLAKSSMRGNIITATVTTAITSIPDINKARKGDISWKECGERCTSNAGSVVCGIAAAATAVALLSNPVGWTAMGVSLVAGMGGSIVGDRATKGIIGFFKKKR